MHNAAGSPILTNVTFNGNRGSDSSGSCGGFENWGGVPTLTNVTFDGNIAGGVSNGYGGGMCNAGGNASLLNVTFSNNSAPLGGGGLYVAGGSPTLTNVTFSGNSVLGGDGGGGVENLGGTLTLTNATFANNTAGNPPGGAIVNFQSGAITVRQSILSGNSAPQAAAYGGSVTIDQSLVQGGCPAGVTCTGAIVAFDPLLSPLAANGGFTKTHALGFGSAAIDAGDNAKCAATDQRGIARPLDGDKNGTATCDLGAYEYQPQAADTLPSVAFSAATSSGSEFTTPASIPVALSAAFAGTVTVNYAVTGGTATGGGVDHTLAAGTLAIPPGQTTASISLALVKDALVEANETVILTLSVPKWATLGATTSHTFTILDGDATAPVTRLSIPPATRSLKIPVTLKATDKVGVTGYLLSTKSPVPKATDSRWKATRPTSFTALVRPDGTLKLYAWTKDAAGNVSATASDTTVLDRKAPVVAVKTPKNLAKLPKLTSIAGTAVDANPSSGLKSGRFAIVRKTGTKCEWWSPKKGKLVAGPCNKPLFFALPVTKAWSKAIGTLDEPGAYTLMVEFTDKAGNTGKATRKFTIAAAGGAGERGGGD